MKYNRKEFEIDYAIEYQIIGTTNILNIPFREVFENNPKCKEYLYDDFCNTEPRPSFRLYLRKYFTDEEVQRGFKEANDRNPIMQNNPYGQAVAATAVFLTDFESKVRDIKVEFDQLLFDGKIEPKFLIPNIPETNIITVLRKVSQIVETIREKPFIIHGNDIIEYCKMRVDAIIAELNKLQLPEIKRGVLESIINNNTNINLYFANKKGSNCGAERIKWNFMKEIIDGLLESEKNKITEPQQSEEIEQPIQKADNIAEIEEDNHLHPKYTFDTAKIAIVYNFCIETEVFDDKIISNVDFINAVNASNFRLIIHHAEQKKTKS